ncbi:alpha/beta fold hydrolase [Nocardia sp. NPDC059240]|uniref:alpha/beta fold hydrolase n=1 Tax=Nocardia sp. NPDC059240 TaxID=3346786 RepID=UPI003698F662
MVGGIHSAGWLRAAAGVVGVIAVAVLAPVVTAEVGDGLQWGPCPVEANAGGAVCATLSVPRDYAVPDGARIDITVSRIAAADPAHKRGVLFAGQGGPGADALGFWGSRNSTVPVLHREFDEVAVQPRGLRWATPLQCAMTTVLVISTTDRSACERADPGYSHTITTQTLARDIEQARQALGVDRIDFYGGSYGTFLGAAYATLFPSRVDRLVLDGNVNPQWSWREQFARGWQAREAGFTELFDWIAANDPIYGLGATRNTVAAEWVRQVDAQGGGWLARLDPALGGAAGALTAPGQTPGSDELSGRIANLVETVRHPNGSATPTYAAASTAVYSRNLWPYLAEGMRRYRADATNTEFLTYVSGRTALDPTGQWMYDAITCNEDTTAQDPAVVAGAVSEFISGASIFAFLSRLQDSGAMCGAWPSSTDRIRVDGTALTTRPLVLQSTRDTATPAAGGPAMAAALNATLIWVDSTDHGSFARGIPEVDDAVVHYLETGEATPTSTPPAPILTPNPPTALPG